MTADAGEGSRRRGAGPAAEGAPRGGGTGPLSAILDAFRGGATSLGEVEERTALAADVVRAGVDHLVRLGRLDARQMTQGCPSGGCGSCASATAQGTAGCGAVGPGPRREGPVLVALTLRRPPGTSTG